ncbi:hypothetical protein CYMTET_7390 [Cymbomonas tetramitiformis]|uniref:Uncharacterized protein n=1 Tax=Cymbomonas tetramitiformis TaxID=36881 RepID=A0AAE0LGX4_9CHLO|nr:hypothetical protein CYMTET_7390 [Cymbomonas tetramitiformis]
MNGFQAVTAGYNSTVMILVLNYALVGMATSAVVKYLDNMTKTFAANAAMFAVAIISVLFYNEPATIHLFIGMAVAAVSVETYNRHKQLCVCATLPPTLVPASGTSLQSKP